ncbi:hypothetical protein MNV49_005933 [Pseudohyphozyma bogoriensis]|nr:hypothetical protein MNV49_005933 [Pseudohyphozyma bogoriensis]
MLAPAYTTAKMEFLDPSLPAREKPYTWMNPAAAPEGTPTTNIDAWPVDTVITDVRSVEGFLWEFTVGKSGFQYVEHKSEVLDEIDTKEGMDKYYKEIEALLLTTLPGAKRVQVFNNTVRRRKHNAPDSGLGRVPANTGPVSRAHVDNTSMSGARRVLAEMGDEGEELSKGRCQIINVWRPLSYPAVDCPLAVLDYRTLDMNDLKATDLILSNEGGRKGENFSLVHNPDQKWYYMANQSPSEPVVFKIYDSHAGEGISKLTPHSAFVNLDAPVDALPRQSVEIRALVFY